MAYVIRLHDQLASLNLLILGKLPRLTTLNDNQENKAMSTDAGNQSLTPDSLPSFVTHELERLRDHWWWFLLLGVLLVIGGIAALSTPFIATVISVGLLGGVLIVGGIITVIGAFWAGKWSAFFLQLLVGILYVMAGMVIRDVPLESVAILTLFIAAMFVVVGVFRTAVALVERFPQWGWALLNGIVTLIAGLIIYDTFPASALWVIGLLVGLELLFNGWTWIMLSLAIRNLPEPEEADATT
jgi:uncharacterized membrane protein HdeD (DUF308 family)